MSTRIAHVQDADEITVGDSGWYLELDLVDKNIDVNNATSLFILFEKPDGSGGVTKGQWPASPHPTEKTVIRRVVQDTDFDIKGNWVLRSRYVDSTNGVKLTGDPIRVRVIE